MRFMRQTQRFVDVTRNIPQLEDLLSLPEIMALKNGKVKVYFTSTSQDPFDSSIRNFLSFHNKPSGTITTPTARPVTSSKLFVNGKWEHREVPTF